MSEHSINSVNAGVNLVMARGAESNSRNQRGKWLFRTGVAIAVITALTAVLVGVQGGDVSGALDFTKHLWEIAPFGIAAIAMIVGGILYLTSTSTKADEEREIRQKIAKLGVDSGDVQAREFLRKFLSKAELNDVLKAETEEYPVRKQREAEAAARAWAANLSVDRALHPDARLGQALKVGDMQEMLACIAVISVDQLSSENREGVKRAFLDNREAILQQLMPIHAKKMMDLGIITQEDMFEQLTIYLSLRIFTAQMQAALKLEDDRYVVGIVPPSENGRN